MTHHPTLQPYIISDAGIITLAVPVLRNGAADVMRIPLDDRTQARLMRDLAAALYDELPHPSLRRRHDKPPASHGRRLQPIDIIDV